MTTSIQLFACAGIGARLSMVQCARNWARANTAAKPNLTAKFDQAVISRRECVGCAIGSSHSKGVWSEGVQLIAAADLIRRQPHQQTTAKAPEESMGQRPEKTFTPEERAAIVQRKQDGERAPALARELGVSESAVYQWCKAAKGDAPAAPKKLGRKAEARILAREKAEQRRRRMANHPDAVSIDEIGIAATATGQGLNAIGAAHGVSRLGRTDAEYRAAIEAARRHRPYTVAAPSAFAHEDVISFLAKLPPMPWAIGDAIRLLAFHAIDGDRDDVRQARERIDAHLRAIGEAA